MSTNEDWSPAFGFFSGFYFATHGDTEQAAEHWKVPARVNLPTWARKLAWVWLRKAGTDPIHLEGRKFDRMFLRRPQNAPPSEPDAAPEEEK